MMYIYLVIFISLPISPQVSDIKRGSVATGYGNILGNKGGVAVQFQLYDSKILFVNSHFVHDTERLTERNANFHKICSEISLQQVPKNQALQNFSQCIGRSDSGLLSYYQSKQQSSQEPDSVPQKPTKANGLSRQQKFEDTRSLRLSLPDRLSMQRMQNNLLESKQAMSKESEQHLPKSFIERLNRFRYYLSEGNDQKHIDGQHTQNQDTVALDHKQDLKRNSQKTAYISQIQQKIQDSQKALTQQFEYPQGTLIPNSPSAQQSGDFRIRSQHDLLDCDCNKQISQDTSNSNSTKPSASDQSVNHLNKARQQNDSNSQPYDSFAESLDGNGQQQKGKHTPRLSDQVMNSLTFPIHSQEDIEKMYENFQRKNEICDLRQLSSEYSRLNEQSKSVQRSLIEFQAQMQNLKSMSSSQQNAAQGQPVSPQPTINYFHDQQQSAKKQHNYNWRDCQTRHQYQNSCVYDSDICIWMGDLNYRIQGPRKLIDYLMSQNMLEVLRQNDQLNKQVAKKRVFHEFFEATVQFMPTYKLDQGTNTYDSSKKSRVPSWTDRILFRTKISQRDVPVLDKALNLVKKQLYTALSLHYLNEMLRISSNLDSQLV